MADYSQIELRLMAHLSGDPAFIEAFRQGGDIHRQTAALIFGVPVEPGDLRDARPGQDDQLRHHLRAGAVRAEPAARHHARRRRKAFIARYFERFAGVRAFLDRQVELAREQGYVETLFGRRRYIPEIRDRNFNMRAYGERNAQNSPLQGSAADLIKIAMIRIHDALRDEGPARAGCCCRCTTSWSSRCRPPRWTPCASWCAAHGGGGGAGGAAGGGRRRRPQLAGRQAVTAPVPLRRPARRRLRASRRRRGARRPRGRRR